MSRPLLLLAVAIVLALTGCASRSRELKLPPENSLDAATQKKIKRGLVEPGFTPEMVYLALGKPSEPANNLVDATRDGTWVYRDFNGTDRDLVRAGFRRRVIFDPAKRSDVVITEPLDTKAFPNLVPRSLVVKFKEGRVVDVARVAEM